MEDRTSETQQQPEQTKIAPKALREKPKYRSGAGADSVFRNANPAPEKHMETDTVFYTKDGIPGTELEVCGTPEEKAGGGLRYPVLTADGKPFKRAGKQVDVVDDLDLLSEEQHKDEVRKKDDKSKSRQFRDMVSRIVGKKK